MSFGKERIEAYVLSRRCKEQPITEVPYIPTTIGIGDLETGVVAQNQRVALEQGVSEDEIERQLAEEGLIRLPPPDQQPIREFQRIDVGGKPMSEMIIEERR